MRRERHASDWLDLLPLAAALAVVVQLVATWVARLPYPHDLEWMEGGMLAHAWRLQHGLPLYPEAGPDWIPFIYPPGYSAVLAVLGTVVELGHPLGRAVSLAGTVAAAAAVVFVGRLVDRGWGVPLAGAAALLACYEGSGAFYDLVRPDGLCLGLTAWALALGLIRSPRATIASGVLLFLAYTVKHNAAAFGVPLLAGIWLRDGRAGALRFALASVAPALLFTGAMQLATEGRFLAYIVGVPASHPVVGARIWPGTPWEIGLQLPVGLLAGAALMWWRLPTWTPRLPASVSRGVPLAVAALTTALFVETARPLSLFDNPGDSRDPAEHIVYALTSLGLPSVPGIGTFGAFASGVGVATVTLAVIAAGLLVVGARRGALSWRAVYGLGVAATGLFLASWMRGHHGGFLNVTMPLHLVVTLAFVTTLGLLRARAPGWRGGLLVTGAALFQLGWQGAHLDLERLVPTQEDYDAHAAVVDALTEVDGPVLSPFAPWLPVQAGHDPGLHLIALWDVDHPGGPFEDGARAVQDAIESGYYGTVIDGQRGMAFGLPQAYSLDRRLPVPGKAMTARTGWRNRPSILRVPRPPSRKLAPAKKESP